MPESRRICPHCRKETSAGAVKCESCGRMLQALECGETLEISKKVLVETDESIPLTGKTTQPIPPKPEQEPITAGLVEPEDLELAEAEPESKVGVLLAQRYRIIRELGRGGFGVVYLAQDEELEMDVAIKFLPSPLASDRDALEQLRSEAKLCMSLSHPNIVRLHNLDTSGRAKFLVMEYVDGPDLQGVLNEKGKLPLTEALPIIRSICKGIQHAHSKRVLHRDLKPGNIILTSKGEVKIADFGIARQMRESMSHLSQKVVFGTPMYMAPEHIMGEPVTVRSDIYSLAALYYELLAGHPPFHKGDIVSQIRFKEPPLIKGIPDSINEVVLEALSKDASKRPASATMFYKALTVATLKISSPDAAHVKKVPAPGKPVPPPAADPAPAVTADEEPAETARTPEPPEKQKPSKPAELPPQEAGDEQRKHWQGLLQEADTAYEATSWHKALYHYRQVPLEFLNESQKERLKALSLKSLPVPDKLETRTQVPEARPPVSVPPQVRKKKKRTVLIPALIILSAQIGLIAYYAGGSYFQPLPEQTGKTRQRVEDKHKQSEPVYLTAREREKRIEAVCFANMEKIKDALKQYDNQYTLLPPDLNSLKEAGLLEPGAALSCEKGKYLYFMREALAAQGPVTDPILVADAGPAHRKGRNVVHISGKVEFLEEKDFNDIIERQRRELDKLKAISEKTRRHKLGREKAARELLDAATSAATEGKFEEALQMYKRLVKEYIDTEVVKKSEDTLRAQIAALERQVTPEPKDTQPEITPVDEKERKFKELIAMAEEALKEGRCEDAVAYYQQALALKDSDEVRKQLKRAVSLWVEELLSDAKLALVKKDRKKAKESIGKVLQLDPQNKEARLLACKVTDYSAFAELRTLKGHTGSINCVCFSPDSQTVASASADKTVKLWNAASGKILHTLAGHTDGVYSVCFSPDGQTIASGSGDKTIKLWNVQTGMQICTLTSQVDPASARGISCVSFTATGKTIASAGFDKTIKLWDTGTGKEVRTLKGHEDGVMSVCFGPDFGEVASGSVDRTIKLWRVTTGLELHSFRGHTTSIYSVRFSPDGRVIASGSGDRTIKLWDVEKRRELRTLTGHKGGVWSVCFNPDGRIIASGSLDKTIKLWDASTGKEVCTLSNHKDCVWSVCFSPDGRTIASGSGDKTVKLWSETGK